jgi:hypothetical protein
MTASAGPVLHDLYSEFGDRVSFLTLYVREAHPGDRYVQPQDFDTKLAQAREYAQRDDIRWPVAVDDIDGTLHRALDAKPNACYVIDADGVVAFRALWTNHSPPLRAALAAVAEGRRGALGQSEAKAVPMLSGTGSMWQVLSGAGPVALRDVAKQAPPMWLSARLAALLRPLPPVGRGAAAMAAMTAATAAGALGARRLARAR